MIALQIDQKNFADETQPLFKNFSLKVEKGEVLAVLGPSGVGKSTLLRLISGIDRQFSGSLTIGGQTVDKSAPCGFVFQDPRLLPWCTSAQNLSVVAPGIEKETILKLLSLVGLDANVSGHYPHQLSGGMQRRLALARALAVNSSLLLLDEPFISLDPALVLILHKTFAEIIEDTKITAILVTHNAEDVAALADRVLILSGRPAVTQHEITLKNQRRPRSNEEIRENLSQIKDTQTNGGTDD